MIARGVLVWLVLLALATGLKVAAQATPACARDPFVLKTAVASGSASAICTAELSADEQNTRTAKRELRAVIRREPGSENAYQAHSDLLTMYFRAGRYRLANKELAQMLREKPAQPDTLAIQSLMQALSRLPEMRVSARKTANIQSEHADGNLYVRLRINGKAALYIVDTGANLSMISEREAKRLGLTLVNSSSTLTDIGGAQTEDAKVTYVRDLTIGQTHIRNAAFVVLPDADEPFVDLPEEQRGLLGLPLLMALGSFRIDPNGTVTIDPPETAEPANSAPLAFVDLNPVTQVGFAGRALTFTLDTGAMHTTLNPAFAKLFPDLVKQGTVKNYKLTGVGGSTEERSSIVPSVGFEFGRPVTLSPATIFLSDEKISHVWAAGNLGFDLMEKALPLTIDFPHMRVEF